MNIDQNEPAGAVPKEIGTLDHLIHTFWDKAQAATELITQLRENQRTLTTRLSQVEQEIAGLRHDLQNREQELKRVRQERDQLAGSNGHADFTPEERENLKQRIRELIARINSHL